MKRFRFLGGSTKVYEHTFRVLVRPEKESFNAVVDITFMAEIARQWPVHL